MSVDGEIDSSCEEIVSDGYEIRARCCHIQNIIFIPTAVSELTILYLEIFCAFTTELIKIVINKISQCIKLLNFKTCFQYSF